MILCPIWLATCARVNMAFFRTYYAYIALCKPLGTRKTVSLRITLLCLPPTRSTMNITGMMKCDFLSQVLIERDEFITQGESVVDWRIQFNNHF